MNFTNFLKILPFLFICAGLKAQTADDLFLERIEQERLIDSTDNQRFDYHYYQAQKLKYHSDFSGAKSEYLKCLAIDTTNSAAWFELSKMQQFLGQYESSHTSLLNAVKYDKKNQYYREILAAYCIQKNDINQAISIFEKLSKDNRGNLRYLYNLLDLYEYRQMNKKILATLNKIEVLEGVSQETAIMKVEYFNKLNQHKKAIAEIEKLIAKTPTETRYKTMLGQYYMSTGDTINALQIFNKILEKQPNNGYALMQLFNYHKNGGRAELANDYLNRAVSDKSMDIAEKIDVLKEYILELEQNKKTDEIENIFDILKKNYPAESSIYSLDAVYQLGLKNIKKAEDNLQTAISLNPEDETNWKILAEVQIQNDSTQKLIDIASEAEKIFPQDNSWVYYKIVGLMQLEKQDSAMLLIDNYLTIIESKAFNSMLLTLKADYLWQQKNSDAAFDCYEKAIGFNSANILALNNYAYFLSECEKDLQKAEAMSGKTIQAEPQNATYLDTYAWILFKQKDYTLAKFYIEKALSYDKDKSAELFEHYGDILFHLGDTDRAVEQWEKARKSGKNSEVLDKKIEEKQYYLNKLKCE
jgi:tetratricopeptide (TPR) repeat protein